MKRITRRRLPNFLLIGAPKCGTTAVHDALAAHPEVFMPVVKEPSWFRPPGRKVDVDAYTNLFFRGAEHFAHRGEATPWYLYHEPEDILRWFSTAPLVMISVRDPVARAWSMHLDQVRVGAERRPFSEVIDAEFAAIERGDLDTIPIAERYWSCGHYRPRIDAWTPAIGASRVLLLETDTLEAGGSGWERIAQHLGLESVPELVSRSNVAGAPRFPTLQRHLSRPRFAPRRVREALRSTPVMASYMRAVEAIARHNRRETPLPDIPTRDARRLAERYERVAHNDQGSSTHPE